MGTWYVRATSGGGSVLTYSGNLTTDQSFSNVVNFSIESSDTVNTSNPQIIAFDLTMGSVWHDGFNFQVPSGNTCLTLDTPPGITVNVAQTERQSVQPLILKRWAVVVAVVSQP